jgi:hypothetical protein
MTSHSTALSDSVPATGSEIESRRTELASLLGRLLAQWWLADKVNAKSSSAGSRSPENQGTRDGSQGRRPHGTP